MSEDATRWRYVMPGHKFKAEVQVEHTANLIWVGAFFSSAETDEEGRRGAPEVRLEWSQSDPYAREPNHGRYNQPDNVRRSTYELKGTIPAEAPQGVYRLWHISFQTASGRFVRLDQERLMELGVPPKALAVEVLAELPEKTHPTGFRFTYDE